MGNYLHDTSLKVCYLHNSFIKTEKYMIIEKITSMF